MSNIIEEQKEFFEYIDNVIIKNRKISHAYFIESNNVEKYNEIINEFIKKIIISNQINNSKKIFDEIDSNNYPDIEYIHPNGFWIKKEQLINLEKKFSKRSMLDGKLIYVIDPADKLNDSSANTILKFLEEPPQDVIAILVGNNRFNVLDTIVSRCQILSLKNNNQGMNIEENEDVISFVKNINNTRDLFINFDYYFNNLFSDKSISILSLNFIENIIYDKLNKNVVNKNILSDNEDKLISYISIIERQKNNIQYNLNIKLWLNNFIMELMEVNNND